MGRSPAASPGREPVAEVARPRSCGRSVGVSGPDLEVELTARPYVAAFEDHSTAHCPAGDELWVYYC